jgi:hypothetical protein
VRIRITIRCPGDQLSKASRRSTLIHQENAASLPRVQRAITELHDALGEIPPEAILAFFGKDWSWDDDEIPSLTDQSKIIERLKMFVGMLAFYHRRAGQLIAKPPGQHGSAYWRQRLAAARAFDLVCQYGVKRARGEKVASLLFEAMTGRRGEEFDWAYRNVREKRS